MPVVIPDDRPRVTTELRDGSEVLLSPIVSADVELIEEGMEHLSVESRFTRFGQGLARLSKAELAYLTNVDQRSHVAWGALVDGEVAGVGRYVATEGCSEIAITVVDEFQQRGLGTLLFEALVAVARADGVEEFCVEMVPGNVAVEHLVDGMEITPDLTGSLLEGRIRIADLPTGDRDSEMIGVLEKFRGQNPWRPSA